jgi:hypothetical protein
MKPVAPLNLGVLLQRYFIERLMQQRQASSRTVSTPGTTWFEASAGAAVVRRI